MQNPISFACPDWEDKLKRGETPIADLPLDPVLAEAAVDLFNLIRVPDIPGQPTMAEAGGEWVRDIVRAAFGSYDRESGKRFIGEVFNLVPKKNSKTTNAAALGLIAMMMNRRPNVDGVIIGPTQEVADKCFAQASGMIAADTYLSRRFKVIEHKKTIIDRHKDPDTGVALNTKLKIKSFDPKVVTGSIPAFAIIDELHLMAEMKDAARVIGQIRGGMITNDDSLLIIITTQSEIPPTGVFKDELEYARGVRDGKITEGVRMLPVLYEFPLTMQADEKKTWRNPNLWPMVLPNLGRSITIERLVGLYQQERDKGKEAEIRWASQHLNIQIGVGMHGDQWIGAENWPLRVRPGLTFETMLDICDVMVAGGDAGGADDLFGFGVIGRERQTGCWLSWSWAFALPILMERRKSIAPKIEELQKAGDLTVTKTAGEQVEIVADICCRIRDRGLFPKKSAIGLDPHGVAALVHALELEGFAPNEAVVPVGQGYKLNGAIKGLERRLFDGNFQHGGQALMNWCVGNAKAEKRGNNVYITKESAGTAKIDPLIALFNAAMLMDMNPVADESRNNRNSYFQHLGA
ncbi:terminase large subunit [Martelella alba]|uniref:Terminase large subunit n=1 Tax=Martelella alba TaxID=2590451 RepID=A0A506U2L2_9HYPH|nr:terminase large subunit [Martelella alba]TPW28602.1 terminase large subunit [Martelella alba]